MGTAWSQFFPPKAKWTAANVPDLSGKIYLVTGGYDGIGYETTKVIRLVHASEKCTDTLSAGATEA